MKQTEKKEDIKKIIEWFDEERNISIHDISKFKYVAHDLEFDDVTFITDDHELMEWYKLQKKLYNHNRLW